MTVAPESLRVDVEAFLTSIGMEQLMAVFQANDIDGEVLTSLRDADLRELGLTIGQRRKILLALERLQGSAPVPTEPPEFEHRRVCVVFCDLVDSVALAERLPPDGVAEVIQFYYRIAGRVSRRSGGHIVSLQGDGIVVIFGYPHATGAHAERAITAGLDVVSTLARQEYRFPDGTSVPMRARVGIASGRIVVGMGQADETRDSVLMFGSAPNKAARIQAYAPPGAVVVDEATRGQAGDHFDFERLPDAALKGFDGRVQLSRVLGRRRFVAARPGSSTGAGTLVGREKELNALSRAWAEAVQARPRLVVVSGDAGLGKSRLLGAIKAQADAEGARILRLNCGPLFSSQALYPVAQALLDEIGRQSEATPAACLDALRLELPDASSGDIQAVGELLGLASLAGARETGAEGRAALLGALTRWLRGPPDRPTLVALEDAHWADPTTRELLEQLGEALQGRLAVIATTRPHPEPLWPGHPALVTIPLAPLAEDAAAQLLGRSLGGRTLPHALRRRVLKHSGGNPLMLEELAKASEQWGEEALRSELEVPTSIYESIAARLDQLAASRGVADMLAVFGTPVPPEALCTALGLAAQELDTLLQELREAAILAPAGQASASAVQFRHMLYRDVVYERLVATARTELHQTAAATLRSLDPAIAERQPDILAHHHFNSQDFTAAAPLALAAGERAAGASAVIEAGNYFEMALAALLRTSEDPVSLRLRLRALAGLAAVKRARLGIASDEVGALSAQVHRLALQIGDSETALLALNGLYTHALVGADYAAAGRWACALAEAAREAGHAPFEMIGLRASGAVMLHTGRFAPAAALLQDALDRYDPDRHLSLAHAHGYDHAGICSAFLALSHWMRGDLAGARRVSAFSVSHTQKIRHAHSLAQALVFQAMLGVLARDPDGLGASGLEARVVSEAHGLKVMGKVGMFWRQATVLLAQPHAPDTAAMERLANAYSGFLEVNPRSYVGICELAFAECSLRRGDPDRAAPHLDRALEMETRTGENWARAERLRVAAHLRAMRGETTAEVALLAAYEEAAESGANTLALRTACDITEQSPTPKARRRLAEAAARMVSFDGGWDERRLRRLA